MFGFFILRNAPDSANSNPLLRVAYFVCNTALQFNIFLVREFCGNNLVLIIAKEFLSVNQKILLLKDRTEIGNRSGETA